MFKRLFVVALLVCAPVLAASKPAAVPRWAETSGGTPAANIATPTSGESDTGWTNGQSVISSSKMNYLFRLLYDWTLYLQDGTFTATSGSALPGVTGSGDTNQAGVKGIGLGTSAPGVLGVNVGTNGDGVGGSGNGTGSGVTGLGAPTGFGGSFTGGAGGLTATANAGNANGVAGQGNGSGSGVSGQAGATGSGLVGIGGATSGSGVTGTASAGNSRGGTFTGQGSGAGAQGTGGATGPGLQATAGGGGSPAAGALALTAQATPSAPSDGQVWYDTTVTIPRLAARVSGATSGTVTALTLIAGFTGSLAYYKDATGRVYLQGNVTSTGSVISGGTAITTTTLPAGFRPGATRNYVAIDNVGTPNVTTVSVDTTGHISFARPFSTSVIMTGTDSVSFLAEN